MNKKLTIPIFLVLLLSCSKDVSINNLESKDGVAYDPSTGEPFNGKAFLDFYDGSLRMKGEYIRGIKNGIWKYYVQGSSSRFYNLDFKDGNITSAEYKDNDKAWSGIPMLYSENDTTIRTGIFSTTNV